MHVRSFRKKKKIHRFEIALITSINYTTGLLDSTMGGAFFFSNVFLKLAGREYYSKLGKEFRFQVIYLILQSFPWTFEFKVILSLFPEQIQSSSIFRTRGILRRILSIYPVKLYINIPDACKILVY